MTFIAYALGLVEWEIDTQVKCAVDALRHSDFKCHNHALNGLNDMEGSDIRELWINTGASCHASFNRDPKLENFWNLVSLMNLSFSYRLQ